MLSQKISGIEKNLIYNVYLHNTDDTHTTGKTLHNYVSKTRHTTSNKIPQHSNDRETELSLNPFILFVMALKWD